MGWWETRGGAVIGDAAADYVEQLARMGQVFADPAELSSDVRSRLATLYLDGIGRAPTDDDLRALLAFCR